MDEGTYDSECRKDGYPRDLERQRYALGANQLAFTTRLYEFELPEGVDIEAD